ncbi:MAG: CBS domain-containing protein, partial [Lysobacteraceae bacterium]
HQLRSLGRQRIRANGARRRVHDLRSTTAAQVMHPAPRTIRPDSLAAEAAELMELHRITSVLVVDGEGRLCGALNTNDLMRAKVI